MRTKHFKTPSDLQAELFREISVKIKLSIHEFGSARILLSGGNTPRPLYAQLAQDDINWSKVLIGLVDDRDVPVESEFSNERMLHEVFSFTSKKGPKIIGMVGHDSMVSLERAYQKFFTRIDYMLLGMGEDGHTASLFPDDRASEASLRSNDKALIRTCAPSHPIARISCSRGLIMSSKSIGLMIIGEKKLEVLNNSEEKKLPISYITNACQQLTTYYSPS